MIGSCSRIWTLYYVYTSTFSYSTKVVLQSTVVSDEPYWYILGILCVPGFVVLMTWEGAHWHRTKPHLRIDGYLNF
ncbi:hypothetical protein BJX68DRAFT_49594 [Aspergillus pseudodeflectus]|uniref:Uncharacterized protein n=1 Tax=Aspergillus pseudodeflectus TaxID=176178 RepID=A0ABR4KLB0_9EURO